MRSGAFVLASLLVSGLAQAKVPNFGNSQVLGTYRIVDGMQDSPSYKGSICKAHQDSSGREIAPSEDCGRLIWLVRNEQQVAILEAPNSTTERVRSFQMYQLGKGACASNLTVESILADPFASNICRARRHEGQTNSNSHELFAFTKNGEPLDNAIANAIVTGATIGLPMGMGLSVAIKMPRGVTVPQRVEVVKTLVGTFFFITATNVTTFTLERVGE
jgi:hypothetical protein